MDICHPELYGRWNSAGAQERIGKLVNKATGFGNIRVFYGLSFGIIPEIIGHILLIQLFYFNGQPFSLTMAGKRFKAISS